MVEMLAQPLGPHVTQYSPASGRKAPAGGALVVSGSDSRLMIDSALHGPVVEVDGYLLSHFHEDHVVDVGASGLPAWIHSGDIDAVRSWDGYVESSGITDSDMGAGIRNEFRWRPIEAARTFELDQPFDLGGVQVGVVPLPGHTPGHCGFLVEPDSVLYLGDVDLTGFGPYYGDSSASLHQWRQTLDALELSEAKTYATFHQKGPYFSTSEFKAALQAYKDVIDRRHQAVETFLNRRPDLEVDELVGHGIVYRPGTHPAWGRQAERIMLGQHLEELRGAAR